MTNTEPTPKKKKLFLILTCVLDIGILAVFKYTGMITETLNMLPFLNIWEVFKSACRSASASTHSRQ